MSYEFRIGWRYLYRRTRSRRSSLGLLIALAVAAIGIGTMVATDGHSGLAVVALIGGVLAATIFLLLRFFSVFTTVSVLGVVLGVAALTIVLAVTTGFQKQFREKVLGVNAHVIIMKEHGGFREYRDVEKVALNIDSEVLAVQPFIFVEMLVTRGKGELSGVAIKGVDPERVSKVLDLSKHMVEGSVEALKQDTTPAPIILGKELARKLKAKLNDKVTVVAPLSNIDIRTMETKRGAPDTRSFVIKGIFYSGFDEYDRRLMYISLKEAQTLMGGRDEVMGVELKVKDVDRAVAIAKKLKKRYRDKPEYLIQDWYQLNKNLFTALTLQKVVLLIVLTLIIIVATFNMVSALIMMVTDKTREIAILRSMGATSGSIARVFQVVGIAIGGVGTALGLALGLTVCNVVASYGYRLDPKVYLIDRLPISINYWEVLLVAGITMVISGIATLFPSAKASSLQPVEGLRYD